MVNSHLSKFTDIHGYSVNSAQYLAAGVGLIFPPLVALMLVQGAYNLGRFIGMILSRREKIRPKQANSGDKRSGLIPAQLERIGASLDKVLGHRSTRTAFIVLALGIYTLLFGLFYGEYIYGSIPHYLGGGRPEPIILVFKDSSIPAAFNLTNDPLEPRRTWTVLLLAELADGVLVADTVSGRIAAVNYDELIGFADDQIMEAIITPAAMPSPMPTVMLTPTP